MQTSFDWWKLSLDFVSSLVNSLAWPTLILVALLLFRRPITTLILAMRSLKWGQAEAKWESAAVGVLAGVTESSARVVTGTQEGRGRRWAGAQERLSEVADDNPKSAILRAYGHIEVWLRELLAADGFEMPMNPPNVDGLTSIAIERGLLPARVRPNIGGLTIMRDLAASSPSERTDSDKAHEYLTLVDAVLFDLENQRLK